MTEAPVITLDGPGGAGKGTVGLMLARRLGWAFLDSGALYRVLALAASRAGLDERDPGAVCDLLATLDTDFDASGAEARVRLNGEDVSRAIREESCGGLASRLAALPEVRAALLAAQRRWRRPPGLVADGRDMGTVVFPDALLKVFLTASPEVRAERRHKQLKDKGLSANLPRLIADTRERDRRDAGRAVAPLKPAPDARLLDSSRLTVEEVVALVTDWVHEALTPGPAGQGDHSGARKAPGNLNN